MGAKQKKITCTFFIGNNQVESLTPEYLEAMAQRLGEKMSAYYTQHPDEYVKIRA